MITLAACFCAPRMYRWLRTAVCRWLRQCPRRAVTLTVRPLGNQGLALLLAVLALAPSVGCASGKTKKYHFANWHAPKLWGKKSEKPDPEVPQRLVATWVDATLQKQGETPKRGFGGRISFFTRENEDPVRVEGQLVVYAFDETDRAPHETQPSRRFIFPKEQFALHESDSKLGASYSVWLPWDEVGGPSKKISLITRFEPDGGPIVLGEQTRHMLPGVTPPEQLAAASAAHALPPAAAAQASPGVALANYTEKSIVTSTPSNASNAIPPTVTTTQLSSSLPAAGITQVSSGALPSAGRGATNTDDPKSSERNRFSSRNAGEGGSAQINQTTQLPPANPNTPLSQMSTMTIPLPRRLGAPQPRPWQNRAALAAAPAVALPTAAAAPLAASAPYAGAQQIAAAQAAGPVPGITHAAAAASPTAPRPQSLKDSLRSTLPARVVPAAQPARGGAR